VIEIEVNNSQSVYPVDVDRLAEAVRVVLAAEGVAGADISLAIVDDEAIHRLNRRYLQHDDPTDVLSFLLERRDNYLEGEVIVSAERAAAVASRLSWPVADELLLYVIHGVLHLVGYDDRSDQERRRMQARQGHHLQRLGAEPPPADPPSLPPETARGADRDPSEGDAGA
jgi:probable rRNA maturation factor